jgi:hypothetical protein
LLNVRFLKVAMQANVPQPAADEDDGDDVDEGKGRHNKSSHGRRNCSSGRHDSLRGRYDSSLGRHDISFLIQTQGSNYLLCSEDSKQPLSLLISTVGFG